jgi:hypothetical protein
MQIATVFTVFMYTGAGNCLLNFTEQPITSVDCLIYDVERIVLKCAISSEGLLNPDHDPLDPSRISIKWYYNNGTESELTVGTNEISREGEIGDSDPIVISSTLIISAFSQHDVSSLVKGSYYCRVNVAEWGLVTVSNSSQQFTVLTMDQYLQLGASCSHTTFIARESACAVHIDLAVVNPITENNSETLATINYQNVTDVITMQNVNATQFTFDPNEGTSKIWIYILVAVLGAFLIVIVVLIIFTLQLILCMHMIRKSKAKSKTNMDRKLA